jgi:hypothetical protein
MRGVEERSLSSILRSKLLTTLINNDVSGKVNASGCASALDKFDAMQMCFASGSAENKAPPEELVGGKFVALERHQGDEGLRNVRDLSVSDSRLSGDDISSHHVQVVGGGFERLLGIMLRTNPVSS